MMEMSSSGDLPQSVHMVLLNELLLEAILQHVSYTVLVKLKRVSWLWNECASSILKRRIEQSVRIKLISNILESDELTRTVKESKYPIDFLIMQKNSLKKISPPNCAILTTRHYTDEVVIAISSLNKCQRDLQLSPSQFPAHQIGYQYGIPSALMFTKSCWKDEMEIKPFNSCDEVNPQDVDLKAVILFNPPSPEFCLQWIPYLIENSSHKIAIGGSKCDELLNYKAKKKLMGLMIRGKNVRAASIVFEQVEYSSQQTLKDVNEKVKRLRHTNIGHGRTDSIAFTFPCCNRYWLDEASLDPVKELLTGLDYKPFRDLFPATPIFGYFGRSFECGYDSCLSDPSNSENVEQDYVYGGTNVMVIVDSG